MVPLASWSIHVAAAKLIAPLGAGPAGVLLLGLLTQILLDYIIHERVVNWQDPRCLYRCRWFLVAEIALMVVVLTQVRGRAWWAVAGALLPDVIDMLYSLSRPQAWMRGQLLVWWHRTYVPEKRMSAWLTAVVAAVFVVIAVVVR